MKVRDIVFWAGAIIGVGAPISALVNDEIDKPLVKVNPMLAKYDKDSDEVLSPEEAFDLLNNEVDKDNDGYLSDEEQKASLRVFDNCGLLPPKNVIRSIDNYYRARHVMLVIQAGK